MISSIQTDRLAKRGREPPSDGLASGAVSAAAMERAEDAAHGISDRKIARRKTTGGDASATAWACVAEAAIGVAVSKFKREYLQRAAKPMPMDGSSPDRAKSPRAMSTQRAGDAGGRASHCGTGIR